MGQPAAQKRGNDMTGLLILLAAALAGTGCYNLSCAFVDVPTAQTSRMMMRARKQTGTSNEKLSCLTCT